MEHTKIQWHSKYTLRTSHRLQKNKRYGSIYYVIVYEIRVGRIVYIASHVPRQIIAYAHTYFQFSIKTYKSAKLPEIFFRAALRF